jgi:hypothetical protein
MYVCLNVTSQELLNYFLLDLVLGSTKSYIHNPTLVKIEHKEWTIYAKPYMRFFSNFDLIRYVFLAKQRMFRRKWLLEKINEIFTSITFWPRHGSGG